VSWGG